MQNYREKVQISFSLSFILALCLLFIGLIISFLIYYLGINNHLMNKIPAVINAAEYQVITLQYGFNQPFNIQLINYLNNFFMGNWGESYIVLPNTSVIEVMKEIIPKSIETMIIPMLIGLAGIKLGRIWVKNRSNVIGYIIQSFSVVGLAMPVFFLATTMQYDFGINDILPVVRYYSPIYPAPPYITGFPFLDSIFSGKWTLAASIMEHGILPALVLTFLILALIIKQTQSNIERSSKETSFISNCFTAWKLFGFLFVFIFIIEITFNRKGFGYYFLLSIYSGDLFVINGSIFMIIIFFSFILFFSNTVPITYKFLRPKIGKKLRPFWQKIGKKLRPLRDKLKAKFNPSKSDNRSNYQISNPKNKVEKNNRIESRSELRNYIISTFINPATILGLGLLIYFIIISAFPQLFTSYPLNELVRPYTPPLGVPFDPPSPAHPLGTTSYAYDLHGRLIWGIRDALIIGSFVSLFGLVGGLIFGFIGGRLHRYVHNGIIGFMISFFIIPGIIVLMISNIFLGRTVYANLIIISFLLIPIFTGIVANAIRHESSYINALKVIIKYIPLVMASGIMLHVLIGYIGLGDETTANLGITFVYGRSNFYTATWAVFMPGQIIFALMLSLLFLHEGLKAPTMHREEPIESVISS
ncbi:MAG: hypothetical protein ACFFE4_01515 [Candidatus Thorarchaeota archaeon]